MKPSDISTTSEYDWVYAYTPDDDGTDGINCTYGGIVGDEYRVQGIKTNIFLFDVPFFLKNMDVTLWFDSDNTPNQLVNNVNWGLYTISLGNVSLKYQLPFSLPDGVSLDDAFKRNDNKLQITTNVETGTINITINNIAHGTVKLEDTILNTSQKHYFGFGLRNNMEDIRITKLILYTSNIDTVTSLKSLDKDNHYPTGNKANFQVSLFDEYGKPIEETVRLYCNNLEHAAFETGSNVVVEQGTRYYNAVTDGHGVANFSLYNTDDTSTSFSVQCHKTRDYFYNYSISEGLKNYYQTTPVVDVSSVPLDYWYTKGVELDLNAHLVDNHGNRIEDYDGSITFQGERIYDGGWNEQTDNKVTCPEFNSNKRSGIFQAIWKFDGNNLYYPATDVVVIHVRRAEISIEYEDLETEYYYPDKIQFKTNVSISNPDYKIPNITYTVNGETVTPDKNGVFTISPTTSGNYSFRAYYAGDDTIASFNSSKTIKYYIDNTELKLIGTGNPSYVNQENYITVQLLDGNKNPLIDKQLTATIALTSTINRKRTVTLTDKTNTDGIVTFPYTYTNTDDSIGATGSVKIEFKQEGNYTPSTLTDSLTWKPLEQATLEADITNKQATYPEPIQITGVYRNAEGSTETVQGLEIKCYRNNTLVGTSLTDKNGKVNFTDTPTTPTNPTDEEDTLTYELVFDGDSKRKKVTSTAGSLRYLNQSTLTVISRPSKIKVNTDEYLEVELTDNKETLASKKVKVTVQVAPEYTGSQYKLPTSKATQTFTTDNNGRIKIPLNESVGGVWTYTLTYETTNTTQGSTLQQNITIQRKTLQQTSTPSTQTLEVGEKATVTVTLTDKDTKETITGQKITTNITFKDNDDKQITTEKYTTKTLTTDNQGKITVEYTATKQGNITATVTTTLTENDTYKEEKENTNTIKWNKIPTILTVTSNTTETNVLEEGSVTVQAQHKTKKTPITNLQVTSELTIKDNKDGTINYEETKTLTTDKTGNITRTHTQTEKGNTTGTFKFTIPESNIYTTSTITATIKWNKIPTSLILSSSTKETETTLRGIIVVKLLNTNTNQIIIGQEVDTSITFKDYDGKKVTVMGLDHTGTRTTNEEGKATSGYTPNNIGDITGTITFTLQENNIYQSSTYTNSLKWNKIKTKITTKPVTHYSGKYTNIAEEEPDWTEPSPGYDKNYTNFWAKLETEDTETTYTTLPDQTIQFINTANEVAFTSTTNETGECNARWTRSSASRNVSNYTVKFEGNNIFKPTTETLVLTTLPRIQPTLTERTFTNYPPGFRYNVPFHFGGLLKDGDTLLVNMPVTIKLADIRTWEVRTLSTGVGRITNYVPKFVGTYEVTVEFNKEASIDKYIPTTLKYYITIDKEILTLTMTPEKEKYASCEDAILNFSVTDSLNRPMNNQKILLSYDDGKYGTFTWQDLPDKYVITNSEGKTMYSIQAYSGIRLIQGIVEETEYYLNASVVEKVEYDISRTYSAKVTDGVVEIPVECLLDSSKGLPLGLYDVEVEYIPPDTETGKCQLYASSSSLIPIHKKKTSYLECLTSDLTTEPYSPLFLTAQLTTLSKYSSRQDGKIPIVNGIVSTMVENMYPSSPYHVSDDDGIVLRGYVDTKKEFTNNYQFRYNQTNEYAGTSLTVPTKTTKITPTITPLEDPAIGYAGVNMTLSARVTYSYAKYDKYGYEIKLTNDGKEIYYNPLALNDNSYFEYYTLENNVPKKATEKEYNNASSQITTVIVKNKDVIWRGSGGVTELVRATTNKEGIATATYHRNSVNTVTIYATTDEDSQYNEAKTPFEITTLGKIETYFVEPIPSGKTQQETVYHHNTTLGAYLKYKDTNNVEQPLANQEVIFRRDSTELGVAKTDKNGYASIQCQAYSANTLPYEVIYRGQNEYLKTSDVFRMKSDPQTPTLNIKVADSSIEYNETTKVTITFKEDKESNEIPIIGANIILTETNSEGKSTNLGKYTTNEKGIIEYTYTPTKTGNITLKATYNGSKMYYAINNTTNLQVNKIETQITEYKLRTSDDGNDVLVNVIEKKSKQPIKFIEVTFQENGKQFDKQETNENGIARGNGAFFSIGTHTIKATVIENEYYKSSETTISLNAQFLIDTCNNLKSFEVMTENWYASDGTSKYGIDKRTGTYKKDSTYVPSTTTLLRTVCNDLKTQGTSDNNGIHAPTGVVLKNKYITTTSTCLIQFKIMFKYGGGNKNVADRLFGGHFGLIDDNEDMVELAHMRFEVYRRNAYGIIDSCPADKVTSSPYAYKFMENVQYTVTMDIQSNKVVMNVLELDEEIGNSKGHVFNASFPYSGLHPYIFAFTNDTELVINELRIIPK